MKFIIAALLLVSFVAAQRPPTDIEKCVNDLKQSVSLIKEIEQDFKNDPSKAIPAIEKLVLYYENGKKTCSKVTKEELAKFIWENLSKAQQDCITGAFGVYSFVQEFKEDVEAKKYAEALKDAGETLEAAEKTKEVCKGAF